MSEIKPGGLCTCFNCGGNGHVVVRTASIIRPCTTCDGNGNVDWITNCKPSTNRKSPSQEMIDKCLHLNVNNLINLIKEQYARSGVLVTITVDEHVEYNHFGPGIPKFGQIKL